MPISSYYSAIRKKLGTGLLLIPAVAAIVHNSEGHVLIQKRPDGQYSLPASAIEPGEQPAQAVVREVYEETGLKVRPTRLLGVFGGQDGYRVIYKNGDKVEYQVCLFACEIVEGLLNPMDGESLSLEFYPPESVPKLGTEYPRSLFIKDEQKSFFHWDEQWIR